MNKNVFFRKTRLALLLFVGLQSVIAVSDAEDTRDLGFKLHWRSENNNQEQLALAIERLYVVLYNIGNLPTRELVDQEGRTVESILRSEGLFFGTHFPVGVDAVMCDVNPDLCSRARKRVPKKKLSSVADHVGGFSKSNGSWRNKAGSLIKVPNLEFAPYTNIADIPFRAGNDIEQLVEAQDSDCSQWKLPCFDLARRLNPALFDPKRKASQRPGKIKLPVMGVEANLFLTGTENSHVFQTTASMSGAMETKPFAQIDASSEYEWPYAPAWQSQTQIRSFEPADVGIKSLTNNIVPFGQATLHGGFTDTHFEKQKDLLELIHHPFMDANDVPGRLKKPVPIAVLDTWFDKEHCELKDRVNVDEDPQLVQPRPGSRRDPAGNCGDIMAADPTSSDDHGTHVAGLIASADNGNGIVGLNPYAKLKYYTIDLIRLRNLMQRQIPSYRSLLAQKLLGFLINTDRIRVANISWSYKNQGGSADPIKPAIQALEQNTLFVVAAGNEAQSRDGDFCGDLPACYRDLENVITVVGLDRSSDPPGLWRRSNEEGSNWSQKFSLGAVAEDVLSTTYQDFTGIMSGTSQAAPQVTAAASLVYSVYETYYRVDQPVLLPIRIKNRLIYTSDLFNQLLDKAQGGRLNVERAIDLSGAYLKIKREGELEDYVGRIQKFGPGYIECRRNQGQTKQISFEDLRRMFYDEHRRKYVILLNSQQGNRDSPLERIHDCDLRTQSNPAGMLPDDGEEVSFRFQEIRDYISAML